MKTVAYSHSSDSATTLYGFACLFVLGFIWAAMGGTGTALPAYLDRDELTRMFAPLGAVLGAWYLEDAARPLLQQFAGAGFNAIVAIAAVLVVTAIRRKSGAPDRFLLTKPNTSCTTEKPASLRSDSIRDHPGMPFGFP